MMELENLPTKSEKNKQQNKSTKITTKQNRTLQNVSYISDSGTVMNIYGYLIIQHSFNVFVW